MIVTVGVVIFLPAQTSEYPFPFLHKNLELHSHENFPTLNLSFSYPSDVIMFNYLECIFSTKTTCFGAHSHAECHVHKHQVITEEVISVLLHVTWVFC